METRANTLIVGIFTLVGITLAVLFALWELRYGEKQSMRDIRVVFAGSVYGLAEGYAVYFKGIKIGEINALKFDPDDPDLVSVFLKVDPAAPLKMDSRARIGVSGFTGSGYIEFVGGTPSSLSLFEQGEVPTVLGEVSPFQDIVDTAQRIANKTEAIVQKLDRFVGTNEPKLTSSFDDIKKFTDVLAKNADGVDDLLANARELADSLNRSAERIDKLVASADAAFGTEGGGNIFTDARETVASIRNIADSLNARAGEISDGLARVGSRSVAEFERFMQEGQRTLNRLDRVIGELENDPSALLFGKNQVPEYNPRRH
ncbi:MAG TPA: MlaD family protein [Kaistiaceae bacterium]|nr:MlaD family protein [Kaistiaceae bacterium]